MKTAAALFAIVGILQGTAQAFQNGVHRGARRSASRHGHDVVVPSPLTPTTTATVRSSSSYPASFSLSMAADDDDDDDIEPSTAETILSDLHSSKLPFRIVVIGNGAILETTSPLGPVSKSGISPKSGERLLTFASEDKSFEFHVKVEQVCKIAFVATEERRVARFLNEGGTPICALILADKGVEAGEWFDGLVEKYGNEVIM